MVIYKCNCGDELAVTENTEQSRNEKRGWKTKHGAPLIDRALVQKGKVADWKGAGIHGYTRIVTRKPKRGQEK